MPARRGTTTKKPAARPNSGAKGAVLRFAHPFYTTAPPGARKAGPHGARMLDHIQGRLEPVPAPRGKATWGLADVIGAEGAAGIEKHGRLQFHACGDTGHKADSPQGEVASAMSQDYDATHPDASPAFFLHLGDVIYGPNKAQQYRPEFYEPYVHYPGKIIAIPGNHDGEVFPGTDPKSLAAFVANFCATKATVPAIAGTIFRQTMTQPGVYWCLDAPFVQIVGMYSNAAENPGFLSGGAAGTAQRAWLVATLGALAKQRAAGPRKALVFATHHPPFTAGGHSPSTAMLAEVDAACQQAGLMPDLWLSGHAHSYQRYTRHVSFRGKSLEIPHIVAGTGGIGEQAVPAAGGGRTGDHVFEKSRMGYGYLLVTADAAQLEVRFMAVDGASRSEFDSVVVDLATSSVR